MSKSNESELSLTDYEASRYAVGKRDAYSQDAVDELVAEIKRVLEELDERDEKIEELEARISELEQERDTAQATVEELEGKVEELETAAAAGEGTAE